MKGAKQKAGRSEQELGAGCYFKLARYFTQSAKL